MLCFLSLRGDATKGCSSCCLESQACTGRSNNSPSSLCDGVKVQSRQHLLVSRRLLGCCLSCAWKEGLQRGCCTKPHDFAAQAAQATQHASEAAALPELGNAVVAPTPGCPAQHGSTLSACADGPQAPTKAATPPSSAAPPSAAAGGSLTASRQEVAVHVRGKGHGLEEQQAGMSAHEEADANGGDRSMSPPSAGASRVAGAADQKRW